MLECWVLIFLNLACLLETRRGFPTKGSNMFWTLKSCFVELGCDKVLYTVDTEFQKGKSLIDVELAACLILDCIVRFVTFSHCSYGFPTVSSDQSCRLVLHFLLDVKVFLSPYRFLSSLSPCFSKKETSSGLGFMHQAQPAVSLKANTNLQLKFQVCGLCYASLLLELCFFFLPKSHKKSPCKNTTSRSTRWRQRDAFPTAGVLLWIYRQNRLAVEVREPPGLWTLGEGTIPVGQNRNIFDEDVRMFIAYGKDGVW